MTVDFLPFANDASANVVTQSAYLAAATGGYVQFGFSSGLAASNELNKVWRQSSVMTAAWANLAAATLSANVLDTGGSGSVTTLQGQLASMVQVLAAASSPPITPQGRLTPTTHTPVTVADVTSSTVVYYTSYVGGYIPVWNGTSFTNLSFTSDLVLTLTAAASANALVDVFAIDVGGVATLGFGPVWGTSTPGSGARGSGAGTTELARIGGVYANANVITLLNGVSTYSAISAGRATYLGTIWVDGVAGQVTCHRTYGQSRKFGVWNAYNRVPLTLVAGDGTASWAYTTVAYRPSNNNTANSLGVMTGLAEEQCSVAFDQNVAVTGGAFPLAGIGVNSTTVPSGKVASGGVGNATSGQYSLVARHEMQASLGINTLTALEEGSTSGTPTFSGTAAHMALSASYRG
jgi:hypothetical protein